MIGSPDLYRSWKEVGPDGLSDVERLTRSEYTDGELKLPQLATADAVREPTVLRRLASALHLVRAPERVPAAVRVAGIRPGIAAVHFADHDHVHDAAHVRPEVQALFLVSGNEDCERLPAECHEP